MTTAVTDFGQFAAMRKGAEQRDPEVLRQVAGQFEALFIETMMKNMRDARLAEPVFGQSDQHEMYQEMFDRQIAVEMASGRGIGLADLLVRQLGGTPEKTDAKETGKMMQSYQHESPRWDSPGSFVREIWPHAEQAAERLDVAPEGLVAQAALETGWGRHVMQRSDGESSNNLFGIKASSSWAGATAARSTLEYRDDLPRLENAQFRAYPDIAATFDDYVDVVGGQPRYDSVRGSGHDVAAFAHALQDAGYATDPAYADKISAVLNSETMQSALADLKDSDTAPITAHPVDGESI